jgi:hypothetical protein
MFRIVKSSVLLTVNRQAPWFLVKSVANQQCFCRAMAMVIPLRRIWSITGPICGRSIITGPLELSPLPRLAASVRIWGPGDIILPNQIIDYTTGRKSTFFEGAGTPVTHVDFTEPYDRELCQRIREAGEGLGIDIKVGGVYAATQGPRLETAAEINRLERDGVDLVGMTGMPEAVLARELGIPYAAINVVANHAAGRGSSANGIHFESLEHVLHEAMGRVRTIIERLVGCQDNCQPLGMSV